MRMLAIITGSGLAEIIMMIVGVATDIIMSMTRIDTAINAVVVMTVG